MDMLCAINELPRELLVEIFTFIPEAVLVLRAVCHLWRQLCANKNTVVQGAYWRDAHSLYAYVSYAYVSVSVRYNLRNNVRQYINRKLVGLCATAAAEGNLEVLKMAYLGGCPWSENAARAAIRRGRREVLEWMAANGFQVGSH